MKGSVGATVLALASSVLAIPSPSNVLAPRQSGTSSGKTPQITVKGNAFYDTDGNRFYVRGVDYQPGGASDPVDPISNLDDCQRDIQYFKTLGINTVRVYTVDNSANHDQCMNELSQAGIYLALDVNSGKYSLNRNDPGPSYNDVYLQSVFATIDAFAKYDNTLLFFSGNEVINSPDTSNCAPYIKAVTRDMKQYIGSRGYRAIPVGYSAADVEANRFQMAEYMNCGTDDERSDFYSFNDYSYCNSNFQTSGWAAKVQQYGSYSIPLFLSEYGCNKQTPRTFPEVGDLYSDKMTSVYSGGLIYEFTEEADNPNYGLVSVDGSSVSTLADYTNLQSALSSATPPSGNGGAKASGTANTCPPQGSAWAVPNDALPAIPAPAQKYMTQGAGKPPGLSGSGSQNAGTQSSGTATPGSGAVSGTPKSTGGSQSGSAAGRLHPAPFEAGPVVCAMVVIFSSLVGATLL